jgi:uncharacterized protein YukE
VFVSGVIVDAAGVLDSGNISAVVAVIGLALTFVALFASWRVGKRSVSTQVYRDTAAAWEAKSKSQDAENADLHAQLAARVAQIADLTGRVTVLQDTVTGARAWDALERRTAEMLSLAAETRGDTRRIHETLNELLEQLTGLTENCTRAVSRLDQHFTGDKGEPA